MFSLPSCVQYQQCHFPLQTNITKNKMLLNNYWFLHKWRGSLLLSWSQTSSLLEIRKTFLQTFLTDCFSHCQGKSEEVWNANSHSNDFTSAMHVDGSGSWSIILFSTERDDLYDVKRDLNPLAAKWKEIGIALRLRGGELDKMDPRNPDRCLSDVLESWLKRNYDTERFGLPTWRWLVEIVADPAGGNDAALADKIARKHLTGKCYAPKYRICSIKRQTQCYR